MSHLQCLKYKKHDSNRNKKIILNTAEDLLNIPEEDFNEINISNLTGKYYEEIYKEALLFEEKSSKIKNKKKLKENHIDKKYAKQKLNKNKLLNNNNIKSPLKSILKTNQRRKKEIEKGKSRSNSKERKLIIKKPNYKIIANNLNVNIINNINNDNKHLFSPEIPSKINPFYFKEIKTKNINTANKNKINNKKFDLNSVEIENNKNIEVNLLTAFNKIKTNKAKNIYALKTENNMISNNNQISGFSNKYKSDEIKNNKKNIKTENKINKITFCIKYDSNYGDNIGILGSIEELGNWSQDKILYLKWNNGNIWKGEINIENLDKNIFEFKFINRNDGIIYWEKGFNNVVDLRGIMEELRYQKKGRYNKYEFSYDNNNYDLKLSCRIKGWE